MLVALTDKLNNESRVIYFKLVKTSLEDIYYCPECKERVIPKLGEMKIWHFAHMKKSNCKNGGGESELHYRAKQSLYEALQTDERVSEIEMERSINNEGFPWIRPDISLRLNNIKVAVEIQHSHMDIKKLRKRIRDYNANGLYVLFIIPDPQDINILEREINGLEKAIEGVYGKEVYYWDEKDPLNFIVIKFYRKQQHIVNEWNNNEYTKTLKSESYLNYYRSHFKDFYLTTKNVKDSEKWSSFKILFNNNLSEKISGMDEFPIEEKYFEKRSWDDLSDEEKEKWMEK